METKYEVENDIIQVGDEQVCPFVALLSNGADFKWRYVLGTSVSEANRRAEAKYPGWTVNTGGFRVSLDDIMQAGQAR